MDDIDSNHQLPNELRAVLVAYAMQIPCEVKIHTGWIDVNPDKHLLFIERMRRFMHAGTKYRIKPLQATKRKQR